MADWDGAPEILIERAAEGMAPAVKGCADYLGAARGDVPPGQTGPVKGIDHFGLPIAGTWAAELSERPRSDLAALLVKLAELPAAESRRRAEAAVERTAPGAAAEDKNLAVEYLSAIPLAVRRALVPEPTTGRLTLPPTATRDPVRALLRLLPVDVPPFPIGTVVAGTSYRLEELLGIGGFGAVYKATNRFEQNQPPRAIKFCLDPSMMATLHRERAILDQLMAAGETAWSQRIVRLYGYALDVPTPFLVYEYVPGGDLTSYLTATCQKTGRGFHPALVLGLIRQIAEGLAFAHGWGLVHRDLKPANVLVSSSTVKLTDFGIGGAVTSQIARTTGVSGSALTHSGAADQASLFRGSGTPLYMSVEQRRGDQPDPRHDLYSLGVVWYQLLVGDVTRELHPGWVDELTEEFRAPPGHISLIQRCVGYFKKRPAHAGEMLDLLPPPAGERPARATAPASARPPEAPAAPARGAADRKPALGREIACLGEHQGWVRGVAFTPDGRRALSGGDDTVVRLWDLENRRLMLRLEGHTAAVMSIAVGIDGRRALTGSWDGTVRLWDIYTGSQLRCIEGAWRAVKSVALTPDGSQALFVAEDHALRLWNLAQSRELLELPGHVDLVQSVAVSADGRRAVSGGADNTLRLWDLENGAEMRRLTGHTDTVTGVAFAPNGRWVLSGGSDRTLRLWDVETGRELRRFTGHAAWVNAVAIAADGRRTLSGAGGQTVEGRFSDGPDTTVRLWDVVAGKEVGRCEGHTASVTSVAISSNGRFALSGGLDQTVRWWELPKPTA